MGKEDMITLADDEREYRKSDEGIAVEKAEEQRRQAKKNARHPTEKSSLQAFQTNALARNI